MSLLPEPASNSQEQARYSSSDLELLCAVAKERIADLKKRLQSARPGSRSCLACQSELAHWQELAAFFRAK